MHSCSIFYFKNLMFTNALVVHICVFFYFLSFRVFNEKYLTRILVVVNRNMAG